MALVNIYFRTLDEKTFPIVQQLRQIRHANLRLWIDKLYAADRRFLHWKDKHIIEHGDIDNSIGCHEWDVGSCNVNYFISDGMKHVVSRHCADNTLFIIVDNIPHPKDRITLFRDVIHKSDLPDGFFKFPSFCSIDSLLEYCETNGFLSFSLKDKGRFSLASGLEPEQGTMVYKEKATGRYWYRDMLHKNHYEVFDNTGLVHLGEADMDGYLDISKNDKKKRLELK